MAQHPKCPKCGNRENFYTMQFHITRQRVSMMRDGQNFDQWEANEYDTHDQPDIVFGVYCGECDARMKGKTADRVYDMNGPEQKAAVTLAIAVDCLEQEMN